MSYQNNDYVVKISLPNSNIRNISITCLIHEYSFSDKYYTNSEIQRNQTTWSQKQNELYIDSIFANAVPIPWLLNMIEKDDGSKSIEILDGGHRMYAIRCFVGNEGVDKMFKVQDRKFNELSLKSQNKFMNSLIHLHEYENLSHKQRMFLFRRINNQLSMVAGEVINSRSTTNELCGFAKELKNLPEVKSRFNDISFRPGPNKDDRDVYVTLTMMNVLNFQKGLTLCKKSHEQRLIHTEKPNPYKTDTIIETYEDEIMDDVFKYQCEEHILQIIDVLKPIKIVGTRELFVFQHMILEAHENHKNDYIARNKRIENIKVFARDVIAEKNKTENVYWYDKYFTKNTQSNTGSPKNVFEKVKIFHEWEQSL